MIGKSMMKIAYLPKISIFLRFGVEKLALLCPDDSIQTLLILSQFQTFGTEVTDVTDSDFWQVGIFHHVLSNHMKKSHNFINLVFMTSSL